MTVAVLFARRDSVYKSIPGCEVYDEDRDARTFPGRLPVVAHPPCRGWGRLRKIARLRPAERDLALWAIGQVRQWGGVLEHPAGSTLWQAADLPLPGAPADAAGGWTLPIRQFWFGHRADKNTWLYIVGVRPRVIPPLPMRLGRAPCVVAQSHWADGRRGGDRPELSKAEREHTPPELARWLVDLASAAVVRPIEAAHA